MEIQGQALSIAQIKLASRELTRITGQKRFVLIGSGSFIPHADLDSAEQQGLTVTQDLDFGIKTLSPREVEAISSNLGSQSNFAFENGFHVETLGESFYDMPHGWEERAAKITEEETTVLAIAPLDLATNKLLATRAKDLSFVAAFERMGILTRQELLEVAQSFTGDKDYKRLNLELALKALDVVHAEGTEQYRSEVEKFSQELHSAKTSGVASLSLPANALVSSAFGFDDSQASVDFSMASRELFRGEISVSDFADRVLAEREAIQNSHDQLQNFGHNYGTSH